MGFNGNRLAEDNEEPCYHHYSFSFDPNQIPERFKSVRYVLIGGCPRRAEHLASYLEANLFDGSRPNVPKCNKQLLTLPTSRFVLYQVGPALVGNHGMGAPSMSIAIHELMIMCRLAGVLDKLTLIRFGTCGGVGVVPGTVCVTNKAMDPMFSEHVELKICNKLVRRPCIVDQRTAGRLAELARVKLAKGEHKNEIGDFEVRLGATVGTNDFYEEQGRTNGSICEHTREDTLRFLEKASSLGVINIEMESNYLAAMCHKLGVAFGIICVSLADRLSSDKVHLTSEDMSRFERRLFWLNAAYIEDTLSEGKV